MTIDLGKLHFRRAVVELGGKDWTFEELNMADLAEFRAETKKAREEYMLTRRQRLIEDAKKIEDIPPMDLLKYIDQPMTEHELDDAALETIDGLAFMAYLSLRKNHTGINRQQVMTLITPEKVMDVMLTILPSTNGESEKNSTGAAANPSPKPPLSPSSVDTMDGI